MSKVLRCLGCIQKPLVLESSDVFGNLLGKEGSHRHLLHMVRLHINNSSTRQQYHYQILPVLYNLASALQFSGIQDQTPAAMSLLPILKDLVPLVKPGPVHVTKSTELDAGTGQTEGMIRKAAIVEKSDKICASCKSLLCFYTIIWESQTCVAGL